MLVPAVLLQRCLNNFHFGGIPVQRLLLGSTNVTGDGWTCSPQSEYRIFHDGRSRPDSVEKVDKMVEAVIVVCRWFELDRFTCFSSAFCPRIFCVIPFLKFFFLFC